ncbi:MAG: hypothetical protein M1837_004460 [Sclerophora amabilis]|nr:MAG: hypothetical protein M1837_004460 [Sclerophora amabilis]
MSSAVHLGPTNTSSSHHSFNRSSMGLFNSVKDKLARKNSDGTKNPSRMSSFRKSSGSTSAQSSKNCPSTSTPPLSAAAPPTRRPNPSGMNPFSPASNEAPPAYSPPAPNSNVVASPMSSTADDPYAFLSSFNTVFLIDDSGSMAGRSWQETSEALRVMVPICTAHDADGIDLYFLNHADNVEYKNISSPADVERIFSSVRPWGGTPTGTRLHHILKPYLDEYEAHPDTTKPLNIIVITDGVPSDDVESVIISAARKLDRLDAPAWQAGIQFFQVGNEQGARDALKDLDDNLADIGGDLRDMVDTIPFEAMNGGRLDGKIMLKAVLGAVTRRFDRMRTSNEARRA